MAIKSNVQPIAIQPYKKGGGFETCLLCAASYTFFYFINCLNAEPNIKYPVLPPMVPSF